MSKRRSLSCLTVAMLLAAAFAVPTAMAMPTDPTGAAEDSTTAPSAQQDRRGEAAAGSTEPAARPVPHPRAVPPAWPEHPTPINRAPAQPVSTGDGGGSGDFPVALILIGGVLVLGGAMAATAMRVRTGHAH